MPYIFLLELEKDLVFDIYRYFFYATPEPVAVTFTVGSLAAIDTSSSFLNRERVAFA